ncbi:recombinase family protein [Roseomonas frigidaquae]|uniref:Recombinase family protein n=1 Tax=Falsiroseomonas frigidaquae TaxID=487318 RepID=A0ABX1F8U3_9PROT|nr:recombinase family protein [Falsiroseomonas frigidaquae]
MPRVAIYARYSSDNQSEASIEDQVRICRQRAEKEGWAVVGIHTDYAISGSSLILRPGVQTLIQEALAGRVDIVLAESLDRLSRDQEDIAGVYKRMCFAGVTMFTLSEGQISELHIGLKGTMSALFLKDLADKTRRGLRGRVEKGMSGGGRCFGYDVVKRIGEDGDYARGERAINEAEAEIVRGIFADYVRGISPKAIAAALNKAGVKAPSGGEWGASTIYGNRERGTGILNNELYIGQLVWNRLRYIKDPDSGRRVSRPNADAEIVRKPVPELRIIGQDLWDRVKAMQGELNKKEKPLWTKNRPKNLLSGLTRCGCCGGGYTTIAAEKLGCAAARNKGTCDNRQLMRREELEAMVLGALREHLMDEELCAEFCTVYTARINQLRKQHNASIVGYRAEQVKLERERQQIIKSITDGVPTELIRDKAIALQRRREELELLLSEAKEAPVLFHPNMAGRYQKEVQSLIASMSDAATRAEAGTILRSLIDKIILTPRKGGKGLTVDLVGDLAGILSIATKSGRLAVESELSKLQPVNEAELIDSAEHGSDDLAVLASMAVVAGNRLLQESDSEITPAMAMVAGERSVHESKAAQARRNIRETWAAIAVDAGTGFEPVTFRL